MIARLLGSLVILSLLTLALPTADGQDAKPKAAAKPATKTAGKGRLPTHYKDVVTTEQKDKIYAIQNTYSDQISKLAEEMKAITAKRDAEIEAVLTADQKKKIDALKSEAAAAKKKPVEATKASVKPVETTLTKPAPAK
jgi:Spy/CpxP family protein refolding chaperone